MGRHPLLHLRLPRVRGQRGHRREAAGRVRRPGGLPRAAGRSGGPSGDAAAGAAMTPPGAHGPQSAGAAAGAGAGGADAAAAAGAVLLLRLAGPLQSWGSASAFNSRQTGAEPTKSGVIGLLAAADGRARGACIEDLRALRLGVRVDRSGTLLRDYHTASDHRGRPLAQAGVGAKGTQRPTSPAKYTQVTTRYYLQDAVFLAALAGPRALLDRLDRAVRAPAFPLALGRRSCVPSLPLALGVHPGSLGEVLSTHPWAVSAY
ncbi:crispr-associated protein, partial [Streptomyces clavuligerus]